MNLAWKSDFHNLAHTHRENKTVAASDKPSCDSLFFQFNRRKSQGKKYESVKVMNGDKNVREKKKSWLRCAVGVYACACA